jgi:hypothetical protein
MPEGFRAASLSIAREADILFVALVGAVAPEEPYLMFQHKDEYDDQDVRLGMNQPYVEYCGQGWSWYGHMLSVELFRDRLCIRMDDTAAARMKTNGRIEVAFDLDDGRFDELRSALSETFRDRDYYRDRS